MGLFDALNNKTPTTKKSTVPFESTRLGVAKNTVTGIPRALSQKVGQPLLKAYAGFGGALTGKTLTPSTSFQKDLYGTDKDLTLRKSGAEQFGVKETGKIAPVLGFAGVLGDLIPGGSSAKAGAKAVIKNADEVFDAAKYVKQQIQARKTAGKTASGLLTKGKTFLSDVKTKMVDFTAPIEDTLNAATKKHNIKLLPSEDIHNQIDRVLRAPTLAGQFAKDNGIVKAIQGVDDLDSFDQYLIAKHATELDTRGIETGRDLIKDQALVKALAPKYEEHAKIIHQYSQKLLDYAVETGLVSKETATMLKARYPDYVPMNRVFNELENEGKGVAGGVASLGKQTAVQNIKGSTREIESPIESLLAKTNDVFKQGEKNLAGKLLAGYEKLPDNPFGLKELTGFEEEFASGFKRGMKINAEQGKDTISFFDDGVKRVFQTTPEIAAAAKALDVQQLGVLGKIFAFPVRVARAGITGINPSFIAANISKDAVSAFINSDKALQTSIANPKNFVRSLFSALKHDDLYEEMVRAGGAGTSFDLARNQAELTTKSIRAGKTVGSKIKYTVTHPGELLRAVENVMARGEEFTRLQQYRGTKMSLLKKGMSDADAKIAAARQAREATVNFARRGEYGKVLNAGWLYMNAGIQGTRTLLRNLKTRPVQTSAKIAVAAMYPVAMATTWNLSDPKRKVAYMDIAEYEKEGNIIIVPPNPTKDKDGNWNVIKIPMSQEINNLVGAVRKPIESAYGMNPTKFADFAKAFVGTISPINPTKGSLLSGLTPQLGKPSIQAATNHDLFTGYPRVSQSLQRLPVEKQVKENTSGSARIIAKKLGVSPIKVEAFIKDTFGGVGSQATHAVDSFLAKAGAIPPSQIGGVGVLEAIASRFTTARGGEIKNKQYKNKAKRASTSGGTFGALNSK